MAVVRPFRGLRYASRTGSELATVLSPPYDVISPQEQAVLHRRSPYSAAHLELGATSPQDTPENSRYTRARALLATWQQEGVLAVEPTSALYLCRHGFRHQEQQLSRWELYAQVRLEEWERRVVLPHELTLPEPKVDRLNLLRATRTNVSPIYTLYPDPQGELASLLGRQAEAPPVAQAPNWQGESFTLWAVTDSSPVRRVQEYLAQVPLYIADGHHRYETALAYQRERRAALRQAQDTAATKASGEEGFNYVFMALTSLADPGLMILPVHRLVRGLDHSQLAALREGIGSEWDVERRHTAGGSREAALQQIEDELAQEDATGPCFGLYGLEEGTVLVLRPRSPQDLLRGLPAGLPPSLQELDLTLLHQVLLHGYMGIGREPPQIEAALGFTHSSGDALAQVDAGAYRVAFLVNSTRVQQMVAVADAREKMPQKSTFFYPKLPTGLVLSPLDDLAPA
ncbi:MAG: DUF1015 domain-containing protein [Chloroflexi bacterium]|nr:DUF1015 domain-containing protein [Chloroflexota bacterium]